MTNRERFNAVLNFENYDRLPIVHFGYWPELIDKWEAQGHLPRGTAEEYRSYRFPNGSPPDKMLDGIFGWDFSIFNATFANRIGYMDLLDPLFTPRVVRELPDGKKHVLLPDGEIALEKYDEFGNKIPGIQACVDYTLKDRETWEAEYLPKLQWFEERVNHELLQQLEKEAPSREDVICIYGGSTIGIIRNYLGVEGMVLTQVDDPELFEEMVSVQSDIQYRLLERALSYSIGFDYAYLWEDLTSAVGPLIGPGVFQEVAVPHYRRITSLLRSHGVNNILVDSDGIIDSLIPSWLDGGADIMFPLEVGKWNGYFGPYREKHGKALKGIGGIRKQCMAESREAVDAEIARIRPMVEMGGYLPAPDHSLPPECEWDLVKYFVEGMHKAFG